MPIFYRYIRSFLWKTGLGKILGSIFWNKLEMGSNMRYISISEESLFEEIPTSFEDKIYEEFIRVDSIRWSKQVEYVLEVDDVLVEPERCLMIVKFNFLIEQSRVFKFENPYPFILPYLLGRRKAVLMEKAVVYDGVASRNYYHHFVNCVNSLYTFFEKRNLPGDIPFIVNRYVFDSPFFRYLYSKSEAFRNLNWRIQEPGEWIRVAKAYRIQCLHFSENPWLFTRKLYEIKEVKPWRKVFLSRDKKYKRCLSNEHYIIGMLATYGFEVVYAEHLSLGEQQALFQETKYLVALQGMGLIQQFFMKYTDSYIIEIMPSSRLQSEYYWQAWTLKIHYYDVVVGTALNKGGNYKVDPIRLEKKINAMLSYHDEEAKYGNVKVHVSKRKFS